MLSHGGGDVTLLYRGVMTFLYVAMVYVTAAILVFRRISLDPVERRLSPRSVMQAVVIGAATSVVTWLVFERLFLVRLP